MNNLEVNYRKHVNLRGPKPSYIRPEPLSIDNLRGFALIYDGFGPHRANVIDKTNLQWDRRRLANLGWWLWAIVG
jgi:hypothetical protein